MSLSEPKASNGRAPIAEAENADVSHNDRSDGPPPYLKRIPAMVGPDLDYVEERAWSEQVVVVVIEVKHVFLWTGLIGRGSRFGGVLNFGQCRLGFVLRHR